MRRACQYILLELEPRGSPGFRPGRPVRLDWDSPIWDRTYADIRSISRATKQQLTSVIIHLFIYDLA